MIKRSLLLIIGTLFASLTYSAEPSLRAYEATYAGRFSGAKVEIDALLAPSANVDEYVFRRWSEPRGFARMFRREGVLECARFTAAKNGLRSLEHHYIDGKPGEGKSTITTFDGATIRTRYRSEDAVLQSNAATDRMVEELKIMPKLAEKESFSVEIVERNALHTVRYSYIGDETITTKLGKLQTHVFERRRGTSSRTLRAWYAPSKNYLAVRLERRKNDKSQGRADLQSLRWLDDQALGRVTPVCP